jgi:hypothetical protein
VARATGAVSPAITMVIILFQTGTGPFGAIVIGFALLVSHLRPGNTLSRLRALPLSALSLGCYLRFPRHVPAMM